MNKAECVLKEISNSLKPEPKPEKKVDYKAFKARVDGLKYLDKTLVTLFKLCNETITFIEQDRQNRQVLVGVASDVKHLNRRVELNLKKVDSVQRGLQQKIDGFTLLEAKYQRMITRVNGVLSELERVLKQM